MKSPKQKIENFLKRFGFFHKDSFMARHAVQFLNMAQFLGVVNDNAFKFLIIFLFIDMKGVEHTSEILFWVGVIYVLPFLLFSSAAGVLADRFSKQRMVIVLKFTEVIIMAFGIAAFIFKSEWASYFLLFLLALQSALFGPPKYSIIPELVKTEKISKANGLITSFTYLGIIVGTFLASFLTQITGRNFPLTAAVCFLIAILGFISSLLIVYTQPKRSKKKVRLFFIREIYRSLKEAQKVPHLLAAIFGSASFLFIGAYFQLNIIPFAIQSLGMSEVGGGYLFLVTAIGIAFGAALAGKLSKTRIEIGLACFFGVILSAILFITSFLGPSLAPVIAGLVVLGIASGLYIVPFDSYIQTFSPDQKRGQTVAATNFLSFCGVLAAPILLYLFGGIMKLSAAHGFTITSILIFLMVLTLTSRLSSYFFNAISRYLIRPFYRIEILDSPFEKHTPHVLVLEKIEMLPISILSSIDPRLHFYIPREKKRYRDSFFKLFSSIDFLYVEELKESALRTFIQTLKDEVKKDETPCLLFDDPSFIRKSEKLIHELQKIHAFKLQFITIKKVPRKNQLHRKHFKRTHLTIAFTDT